MKWMSGGKLNRKVIINHNRYISIGSGIAIVMQESEEIAQ
jgi:hypothetical protein